MREIFTRGTCICNYLITKTLRLFYETHFYCPFIDDIFLMWTHGIEALLIFPLDINGID